MTVQPVRIQLVDDHEIVLSGFRHLLESETNMQVVAESTTGKQARCDYAACLPDILIMDISLPDISGLEVMRRLLLDYPGARILMLSMHTGMVAERAMQLGARGFVCKRSGTKALISAIHRIMRGGRYLDEEAGVVTPVKLGEPSKASPLSKREIEICIQLSEGHSVAEIAAALHLSKKTVYTHRQNIMTKLGVKTTIEITQLAARMGIVING